MMAAVSGIEPIVLGTLLEGFARIPAELDVQVSDLSEDSRSLARGGVFIARKGAAHDATRFGAEAARAGAVAMVFQGHGSAFVDELGLLRVPVARLGACVGQMAHRYFGGASERLRVVAVTGTNGKSSVVHHVAEATHILSGAPAGIIGTLGSGLIRELESCGLTTPDCVSVHRTLGRFVTRSARLAAIEASSHALDQQRLAGVRVDTAVFTNLTRDHLDYHGDMATYASAKLRLFTEFEPRAAVLNADDPASDAFRRALAPGTTRIEYSLSGSSHAAIKGRLHAASRRGVALHVDADGVDVAIESALLGRVSAENLIAALGVLMAGGVDARGAAAALARVTAVRGRLEAIDVPGAPLVVVDYAHTPSAIRAVLETLRSICVARLWCVFGAGGDRDRGKRPAMGEAASAIADEVVLTDDNPRFEDGDAIVRDVLAGVPPGARARVRIERDREQAIRLAVRAANASDVVLIAGKGHETVQQMKGESRPFDDAAVTRSLLTERES